MCVGQIGKEFWLYS